MVTPENDNGVVRIGALLKGVQYASNHGVGITYVGEVSVYGIVPGIQRLQFLEDTGTGRLHFSDLLGKILQIIFLDRR